MEASGGLRSATVDARWAPRAIAVLALLIGCIADAGPELSADFEKLGNEVGVEGWPARVRHLPSGVTLVLISPGRFSRGSPESEVKRDGDEVQHEAVIASPFYLAETEVTVAQWRRVMGTDPDPDPDATDDDSELPKTGVTWHLSKEFVDRLNARDSGTWRLPTEAEWEFACRAGTTSPFSFGDSLTTEQANYNGHRPYAGGEPGLRRDGPLPVRSLPANPWGLYEMHGNLWEWCQDLYVVHPERGDTARDVPGASRVMRGGSFLSRGDQLRCAYRDGYPPMSPGDKYGLRLALSLPN